MRQKITILYNNYKDYPEATEISRSLNYLKTCLGILICPCCLMGTMAIGVGFGIAAGILAFLLCCGLIYLLYKLMDSLEEKKVKQAIEKAKIENENRLIFVCGGCGYVGSDKKENSNVICPKCKCILSDTHITRAKWITLSEQGKDLIKSLYYPTNRMQQNNIQKDYTAARTTGVLETVHVPTKATCSGCGAIIPEGARFCANCGRKVIPLSSVKFCRFCGSKVHESNKFCPQCGKSLV